MKLNRFITTKEQARIEYLQAHNPELTLEGAVSHNGLKIPCIYESLSEQSKHDIAEIEVILRELICGFIRFGNFTDDGNIRFFYDWNADSQDYHKIYFDGVGYIDIKTLREGFES